MRAIDAADPEYYAIQTKLKVTEKHPSAQSAMQSHHTTEIQRTDIIQLIIYTAHRNRI